MTPPGTSPRKSTLLHVEDARFWAEYVEHVVRSLGDIEYLGCAATLGEARAACAARRPVVLLLDSRLPDGDGLALAGELRRSGQPVRIAAFTVRCDSVALRCFDRLQLDAMIWKDRVSESSLRAALRDLCAGARHLSPELQEARRRNRSDPAAWWKILSDREQDLLPWIGEGLADAAIAEATGANTATIRVHRQNIMRKLGLHRTVDLVRWTWTEGFAPQPSRAAASPTPPVKDRF